MFWSQQRRTVLQDLQGGGGHLCQSALLAASSVNISRVNSQVARSSQFGNLKSSLVLQRKLRIVYLSDNIENFSIQTFWIFSNDRKFTLPPELLEARRVPQDLSDDNYCGEKIGFVQHLNSTKRLVPYCTDILFTCSKCRIIIIIMHS